MALIKEVERKDNGIVTNYHMVSRFLVDKDNTKVSVAVKHYANQNYRLLEKNKINSRDLLTAKYQEQDKLMQSDKKDEEKLKEISEEIIKLEESSKMLEGIDTLCIYEDVEELEFENKEYSLRSIYQELKKSEKYKNAKDDL